MRRYWHTLRRFWGTAVAVQLEYQANVLIELLAVAMSLSGSLFLLSLFYGPDQTLGGWSWAQALMVQGLYTVFDGMATTWLRPNLGAIVTHVREGTLDFVLLKPIDSLNWVSLGVRSKKSKEATARWVTVAARFGRSQVVAMPSNTV